MIKERNFTRSGLIALLFIALFGLSCVETEKSPVAPASSEEDPSPRAAMLSAAVADLWVYQEALHSPWINASWGAAVTFGSAEQAYGGTNSIKVVLTSAWGALSVHYGNWGSQGIPPGSYEALEFAVYGATSGTNLAVFFENDAGQPFPKVNYGAVPAGQWIVVTIPMSQLNPNGYTVNRVDIQDLSGSTRTFYIDDFRFVAAVSGSAPTAPALNSPANGSTGVPTNPTLAWNASAGAVSYRMQAAKDSAFVSTVADRNVTGTSASLSGLSNDTRYYWRVNASNSFGASDWSAVWSFTTARAPTAAPDLTVDADRLRSSMQIRWKTLSSNSCAVIEGCAAPGSRKLLRFDVVVPNFGTADLFFGDPENNPALFQWSPCHGHYHLDNFAEYRLLNSSNQRIVTGRKQAFCLLDSKQYWSGYPSRGYNCDYQGISVGWADVYSRSLDCQWLDITGVPSGNYTLEVEVNVGGMIQEGANTWPNIVRVSVRIP